MSPLKFKGNREFKHWKDRMDKIKSKSSPKAKAKKAVTRGKGGK